MVVFPSNSDDMSPPNTSTQDTTQDSILTLYSGWGLSFPQESDTEFVVSNYIAV
jgi:hypothetical protein